MDKLGILHHFDGYAGGKSFQAWKILKDGSHDYILLPEEMDIGGKIFIIEAELGERVDFFKNELFFVDRLPFVKKIWKRGYIPSRYEIKPADESSERVAVEAMTHKFGDIVGDKVVTRLSSRWKQKRTGRMLEYNYFDLKHLHELYKPER